MKTVSRLLPALAVTLLAAPALAHTGQGEAHGLSHGFAHPLMGLDHVLAMVGVGLIAARIGGRAVVLVPLAFLAMMAVGGTLGASGHGLPFVEVGIALSVVVIGLAVALRLALPTAVAMALVGLFAVFHGQAHGAEMPEAASALSYGFGFIAATALLHAVGLGLGYGLGRLASGADRPALRLTGAGLALAGVGLLVGAV